MKFALISDIHGNLEALTTVLKDIEKTTKTEIIKKAIVEYYLQHIQNKTPYETGEALFGRFGSDEDLSQSYKAKLKDRLNAKHTH